MIDPTSMSAVEWTDRMAQLLPEVTPMKLDRDEDWKDWGRHVVQSQSISDHNPPNPDQFDDWRDWAYRFNNAVFT